jgi:hypothetical protein
MQIARSGLESATVADLGLQAAAKVLCVFKDDKYNPFLNCDDAAIREWHLFGSFLVLECGWAAGDAGGHIEWVLQRPFTTVDEWLGPEGIRFRKITYMIPLPNSCSGAWHAFRERHSARTMADIVTELDEIASTESRRKRKGSGR